MNKEQLESIKRQIDANNALIKELCTPSSFTLNNVVSDLLKQNDALQKKCTHDFQDGFCIYCYKMEDKE